MITLLLSTALAAAAPAAAPEPKPDDLRRNAHAVQLSFRVADCVVAGARRETIALLQQSAGSEEELRAFAPIGLEVHRCYQRIGREDSMMTFPLRIVRAQVAEAIYRRDFGSGRLWRTPASLPAPDPLLQRSDKIEIRRSAVALGFATCVAAADPQASAALLGTTPYSSEEQGVLDRLAPHFGGCLSQGQELQINYPLFRGFVAEALYRQRTAARP